MRNRIFWGVILIILGLIFLFGYQMNYPVWNLIWPFMIIVAGSWILLIPFLSRGIEVMDEEFSVPLEGVQQATIKIEHGAGTIHLRSEELPDSLLKGNFRGGVKSKVSNAQGKCHVKLQSTLDFFKFVPRIEKEHRLLWDLSVNPQIPLKLKMETGASSNNLDFRGTQLQEIKLETGASTTELYLSEKSTFARVHVESGASTIRIHVPENVAARIKVGGLIGKAIDTKRFPNVNDMYISPDYNESQNQAEIEIESGVGSIEID
ncbi:MAG: hypothetical protein GYA52_03525 [Chloroflexi bacterium]|nr:hypothetical protein [Chloroflexota bacterium]